MKLKILSMLVVGIVMVTIFSPLGYGLRRISIFDKTGGSCEDDVWVEALDWNEYKKIRNFAIEKLNKTIDAVGDKDQKMREEAREQTGIPDDPEVMKDENMFIMGPTGEPVMIYDIQKHRVVSPAEACHMTNIVVDGKMSFATRTDETRFCGVEEQCEGGGVDAEVADEMKEKADKIVELKSALDQNDTEKINSLKSDPDIREAFDKADVTDVEEMTETQKINVIKFYSEELGEEAKKLTSAASPFNIMVANEITIFIERGVRFDGYLIPETLLEFIQFLQSWKTADDLYASMMIATMVMGVASARSAAKQAKARDIAEAAARKEVSAKLLGKSAANMADEMMEAGEITGKSLKEASDELVESYVKGTSKAQAASTADYTKAAKSWEKSAKHYEKAATQYEEIFRLTGETKYLEMASGARMQADAFMSTANSYRRALGTEKIVTAGKIATLAGKSATLSQKLIRFGFISMTASYIALTWYNDNLQHPYFLTDTVVFLVNKESCEKIGDVFEKGCYLQTVVDSSLLNINAFGPPGGSWFFLDVLSTYFTDNGPDVPVKVEDKMNMLENHVLILDQMNPAQALYAPKNINLVSQLGNGWSFFSKYNDRTGMILYEHPSGHNYVKESSGRNTAIWLYSRNLDIMGGVTLKTDAFRNLWLGTFNFLSATGYIATIAGVVVGIPAGVASASLSGVYGSAGYLVGIPSLIFVFEFGLGFFFKATVDTYEDFGAGVIADMTVAYDNPDRTCKAEKPAWEGKIAAAKAMTYAVGIADTVATIASFIIPGAQVVALAMDAATVIAEQYTLEQQREGVRAMTNCMETRFEFGAQQEIPTLIETQEVLGQQFLTDITNDIKSFLQGISPEAGKVLDQLVGAGDYRFQLLHLYGESTPGRVNILGEELYDIHFKDADLRWFQGPDCNIDFCSQEYDGTFKCLTQGGYFLFDEEGNPLFEYPIPQALSMHLDMDEMYAGLVQKVINVKKVDETGELLIIYPDRVEVTNPCLSSVFENVSLSGVEKLGKLDVIQTDEGIVWSEGNELIVRLFTPVGGETPLTTVHVPEGFVKFYRNGVGKLVIGNSENENMLELSLGSGIIAFTNGMIRSGFEQGETTKTRKAIEYKEVYHIFIYDLLSFDKSEFESLSIADLCEDDEGNFVGISLMGELATAEDPELRALLEEICFTDIRGQNNESIIFKDGYVCITDINGNEQCFEVQGYNSDTGRVDLGDGYELGANLGPDGVPEWWVYLNGQRIGAPIPMLWATGLGGAMMYNPDTGTISIKNEFPFAINPNFGIYGGGGLGMITPSLPPWGGTPTYGGVAQPPKPQPNILAQLPWMPGGFELVVFILILFSGLLLIRVRYVKKEYKKKRDTP